MVLLNRRPAGEAGFSMIEALVAGVILLIIALGLIPLYSRSIGNNLTGNDALQSTNFGRAELEEMIQLPFNNQSLTVPAGVTQGTTVQSWTQGSTSIGDDKEGWAAGSAPTGRGAILWQRTLRIRQYGISDLEDGQLSNALPGGTQPIFVHLKEVEVQLDSGRRGGLVPARALTLRVLKPF